MTTTCVRLGMTDVDDDDAAPLLPHEIAALTPPAQRPQVKRLIPTIAHETHVRAASLLHPRPLSPLEPFPAFDPSIEPPPPSPSPPPSPNRTPPAPSPPSHRPQPRNNQPTKAVPQAKLVLTPHRESDTDTNTPAAAVPSLSREDFLPSMIRCHTLFSLAERLPSGKALGHLREARGILGALELSRTPGPQMIQLSTDSLRKRLRALETSVAARAEKEERERTEKELDERTVLVTAWLGGL